MSKSAKTFLALPLVTVLAIVAESLGAATFNIRFVQNDAPSPTLFSCKMEIQKGKVSVSATGDSSPIRAIALEPDRPKPTPFKDHSLTIEDDQTATNLLTIAKHFELCHEGSAMDMVSGGIITKIECLEHPKAPAKKAFYIALDSSNKRANLMDDICLDIQMLVVSDVLKEDESKNKTLESLRAKSTKLSSEITAYTQAMELLEDAQRKGASADWRKISSLVRFRPGQPPVDQRSRLVRTAHDILTASCSTRGLQLILGRDFSDESELILKIGVVRRCKGSFAYPNDPDWGFDDIGTSLGFSYPPTDPGLRLGILDLGIERLLLHFLLHGAPDAPTAHDRFSLALCGGHWSVIKHSSFDKTPVPPGTKERCLYLSAKSGLLEYLLGGKVPERVVFLDIGEIAIEDDDWQVARVDYRIGGEEHVLPLFVDDGTWVANHPWTDSAYWWDGAILRNSSSFRSLAEVQKHNAEQDGAGQPATRPQSKSEGSQKPQPESEGRSR